MNIVIKTFKPPRECFLGGPTLACPLKDAESEQWRVPTFMIIFKNGQWKEILINVFWIPWNVFHVVVRLNDTCSFYQDVHVQRNKHVLEAGRTRRWGRTYWRHFCHIAKNQRWKVRNNSLIFDGETPAIMVQLLDLCTIAIPTMISRYCCIIVNYHCYINSDINRHYHQ